MGSKIFILLGLSVAFVLLISFEVAARDLAETTTKTEGGSLDGGGHYNAGGLDPPSYKTKPPCIRKCYGICCSAAEAQALVATTTQVKPHN